MPNAQKRVLENTFYYLENYLNPDRKWDKKITPKQRINKIKYADVNWKTVSDHIKGMDYQNFLKTPYWKAITAHTKYKAGYRCQLCNSAYDLVTHHRNYDIHGREHDHIQELIVLCDDCHSKFHDQIPKSALKAKQALAVLLILSIFLLFIAGDSLFHGVKPVSNKAETLRRAKKARR